MKSFAINYATATLVALFLINLGCQLYPGQ